MRLEKLEKWKKTLNVLKGHRPTVAGLLGDPKLAKIGVLSGPNLGKFGLLGSPKLATFGLLGAHNWPYSVFAAAQNWPKLAAINQQLFWRLARAWDANMCAQSGVWTRARVHKRTYKIFFFYEAAIVLQQYEIVSGSQYTLRTFHSFFPRQ